MFSRIVVAVEGPGQSRDALDLVLRVATPGETRVQVLHLRERELSGYAWYSRETKDEASCVADAAIFELRMAGIAAGGNVRYAVVDRVAEAILREAEAFEADLIVLGRPHRGELATRLLGGITIRVLRRVGCAVIVAPRRARDRQQPVASSSSPGRS